MELPYKSGNIIKERYRIIGILGQGGTATTYEAEDIILNKPIAIKVLSLHQSQDWKAIELFEREAKVLANLNHPRIPKYYDYFYLDLEKDRHFFIVQELIAGKSLKTLVEQGWYFQESDVKKIAKQVLEILSYLHSLRPSVIHRDIKPHNIIRTDAGNIYLVDFGSVQDVYRNTITRGATFVGTIDYIAPEQIRGQASFASDLYSLGCTLLYLLTKRSPSELPLDRMKINFHKSLELSASFANWLDTILEPVPEDRFKSTAEALTEVEREDIETNVNLIPVRNSKIEFQRDRKQLLIKIPPAGILSDRGKKYLGQLIIELPLITIVTAMVTTNYKVDDFIVFYPFVICFIFIKFIVRLIPIIFCHCYLKLDKNTFVIIYKAFKFKHQHELSTQYIDSLRIKRQENQQTNNTTIKYALAIYEGAKEYQFAQHITEKERKWLLEVIASYIEYLYPGTRLPSQSYSSVSFKTQ